MTTATVGAVTGAAVTGAAVTVPLRPATRAAGHRGAEGEGGRPRPRPHVLRLLPTHRHVSQFASWSGPLAIQVHVGARHGQSAGQQGGGVLAPVATEDVDAGHAPVRQRGRSQGQVKHPAQMVLELGGDRPLHRPVPRVVRPGRHLVDQEPATGPEELDRHHPRGPDQAGHPVAQVSRPLGDRPRQAARHQHLAADPADLGRLDRRPGHRLAGGSPGHQDGQLGLQRHQLLHHDAPGDGGEHGDSLGLVGHRPDAFAVVAAAGRLEHEGPAMGRAELGHGLGGVRPGLEHGVGGDGDAGFVEHGAHVRLVDGELQGGRSGPHRRPRGHQFDQEVEVDLLVVEGHHTTALGQRAQRHPIGRRAHDDLGRHGTGGVVGVFGQHGHGEAEGAGGFTGHARQLAGPDEPDVVGAQLARLRARIRLDSGSGTTGRLRGRTAAHGKGPAHREHD